MGLITILLCGLLALVTWVFIRRLTAKKLRLPPSTEGVPFLGHLLTFLQRPESETNDEFFLNKMKNALGDIFMLNLAGTYAYIVSSPDLIRTVFAHADIQGRPSNKSHKRAFGPRAHGIILSEGKQWSRVRRFTTELFRRLGVGRARFEDCITSEVDRLSCDLVKCTDGEQVHDLQFRIQKAIMNIVSGITVGKQFEYREDGFKEMILIIETYLRLTGPSGPDSLVLSLPFGQGAQLRDCMTKFKAFCLTAINDHQGFTDDGEQNDFVGAFLQEIEDVKNETDAVFNHENLMACCLDMFVAGVDTVSSSLAYAVLFLVTFPECQRQCQEEIDVIIGRDRKVTFADRDKLPYLQATISESLRLANVAPFGAPHVARKNLEMFGYDVPKGTMFMSNYAGIFLDEKRFPNSGEFNPSRFIEDGIYKKDPDIFPFGTGYRTCPGELLARMELLLFLGNLLQKFIFRIPEGAEMPDIHVGKTGGTRSPLPYPVIIQKRD